MQLAENIVSFHNEETEATQSKAVKINKAHLINKLNFINFQNDFIRMNLNHPKFPRTVSCDVRPQPCSGDHFNCLWADSADSRRQLKTYEFQNLVVTDGQKQFIITPRLVKMTDEMISFILTDSCCEVRTQANTVYSCNNIDIKLIQNSVAFNGTMTEFSPAGFHVNISYQPPQTPMWIDPASPANIIIHDKNEIIYSGQCQISRYANGQYNQSYFIEPSNQHIRRFKAKKFRSTRVKLDFSPNLVFRHPLTKKITNLKVCDLSGLGFSVCEDEKDSLLLPGLIIPDVSLNFANSFKIKCKAQVLYRENDHSVSSGNLVRCGLTILDMDVQDHVKLLSVMYQTEDMHTYLCSDVNLDELWNFFFETGFIYPEKYAYIEANKDKIKKTYETLYTQNSNIAMHFTYQDKGRILGHMSTLRFYQNAWLIHHHAARKSESLKAGIAMLDHISRFSNDSHNLFTMHMDYLICYYRPNNKFPNRVFGGAQKHINDPEGCSVDSFAYLYYECTAGTPHPLPDGWELTECSCDDLIELQNYYQHVSGGLMLKAFGLSPAHDNCQDLAKEYQKAGLTREVHVFSLKENGTLKAVLHLNISDAGLNMSDLTNGFHIMILDPDDLPKNILYHALSNLSLEYEHHSTPVLIYPSSYPHTHDMPTKKIYNLWVLNTQYSDPYFHFLNRLLKFV